MERKHRFVLTALATLLLALPASAQEIKDPNPAAGAGNGTPSRATGGPDAFGYTFFDGAEPECAPTMVIDISGTGTAVGSGDDVGFPVALGGAGLNFYGANFTTVALTSNGYVSTDSTDTGPDLSNDCPLPATPSTGGGARIYPLHDDLNVAAANTGMLFYEYQAPCSRVGDYGDPMEACHVFMWDNVAHFGGTVTWDMNTLVYEVSGEIVHLIGAGNDEAGSGSTTGIQNDGATIGLTYACDTAASVPDDSSICFFDPAFPPGGFREPDVITVPTMNTVGLALLGTLLAFAAFFVLRRRQTA